MLKSILLFTSLMFLGPLAYAELQVFPLRVVLTDKDKTAQIALRHRGTKEERYRITTVFYRMGADGSMKATTDLTKEDADASSLFRYSPRQVLLQPNVEQVVRIMSRVPADLPDGEYRTHLHFEAMSDPPQAGQPGGNQAQMMLIARMAVAIPVVIKKGQTKVDVALSNFKIQKETDGKLSFVVDIQKSGNGFAYGNFEIVSIDDQGKETSLATVLGISSYIEKRVAKFPLAVDKIPKGKIKLLFKEPSPEGDRLLAQVEASQVP